MSSFLEKASTSATKTASSTLEVFFNSPSTTIITLSSALAIALGFKELVQSVVSGILQPLVNMLISLFDVNYINKKNVTLQISTVIVSFITFTFIVLFAKLYVDLLYDKNVQAKLIPK